MHNLKAHANSQTAALHGNKSILIPGMSLLILEEWSEVSRGIASYQYETWPSMVETRGNSHLSITFWPSELKAAGKVIWGWEPQIAFPLTLSSFSQSIFLREVIFHVIFPVSFLIMSQVTIFASGATEVSARQVWEEGRVRGGLVCTA